MKTKFPYRLWRWTGSRENLFDLARDDLMIFSALVAAAS